MSRYDLPSQLFLLLHDAFTGKLEISRELFDCGLVTAQLAELMIAGRIAMEGDRVVPTGRRVEDSGAISAYVMEAITRQHKHHTVRTWVESMGPAINELVARRLLDDGVVRQERRRGFGRGGVRYPALDLLRASSPRVRLLHMLNHPAAFDLQGALCTAIVGVLGAERVFEIDIDRGLFADLDAGLPAAMQTLMAGLAASVAAVSLTVHR
jgi:hypothetical protein